MRPTPILPTRWPSLLPLAVTLLVSATPAHAQERTHVGVQFILGDELYRSELTGAEITQLETDAGSLLAAELGRRIGYLDFRPSDSANYQVQFVVARRSAAPGGTAADALAQIGVFARLRGTSPMTREVYWLTLRRPEDALMPVGTPADILDQLRLKLRLNADYNLLSDSLLVHVPLADSATSLGDPFGWLLPFSRDEVCLDLQSRLQIVGTVPSQIGQLERVLTAEITSVSGTLPSQPTSSEVARFLLFGEAEQGQQHYEELRQAVIAGKLTLRAIYVIKYQPSPCLQPVSPGEGPLVSGGGS